MKRILCPTDFSPPASNAIQYAAKLAGTLDASLTLLHVKLLADLTPAEALLGTGRGDEAALKQRLEEACEGVRRAFKVSCDSALTTGGFSLPGAMNHLVNEYDLLVIGTNGEDSHFQEYFGSNAYRVIRKSEVPAITVPETSLYSEIKQIVYAYDLFERWDIPLKLVTDFARKLNARLTILQVSEDPAEQALASRIEMQREAIDNMYKGDVDITFRTVLSSDISEGIQDFVARKQPDLLALCINNNNVYRLFASSVFKVLAARVKCPLLAFHH